MFSIAFIKSNDLAAAMDARSYNPRWSRTQFRYYGNKKSDLLALFLMSMIFGLLIILCFSHIYISIFSFTDILLTQGSN
jgi:energy-coupling factor transport system permease protein